MKIVMIAIDSKFPHTNIAVRSIAAYAMKHGARGSTIAEFTINQRADYILSQLYERDCEAYLFSCYIWNVELIRQLARELRKIRPERQLWIGGPEVTYHSDVFLRDNPVFDLVIRGEGEETCFRLMGGADPAVVPGVTYRSGDKIAENPGGSPPNPDHLPFPYDDPGGLSNRVLYYESMRGCPFSCAYCLSSIEKGVRYRSLDLVFSHLQRFLDAGVKRVKLVDRTFNCNSARALEIWRYLQRQDNGVTNFHFEMAGELLDDESIEFLSALRPGFFQFEIGIQSTNPGTLREIQRPADIPLLFSNIKRLSAPGNIHLHLDLIAGLPFEDYQSFSRSFNDVYAARPAQLQLGFLKVLKGSAMEARCARYQLLHRDCAPYQVLSTKWLSYGEIDRLSLLEDMVERYYNTGQFDHISAYICRLFSSPFAFFEALGDFWKRNQYDRIPRDKAAHYQILGDFMNSRGIPITDEAQWLCRYDIALSGSIHRLPRWIRQADTDPYRKQKLDFYKNPENIRMFLPGFQGKDSRRIAGSASLLWFPFQPGRESGEPVFLLFDYSHRDIWGRARVQVIPSHYILNNRGDRLCD